VVQADKLRKSGSVVMVLPVDPKASCLSLIATRGTLRMEKITRIREQIRQGTYHIGAAEVAKAMLRSKEIA
jgi:anti-sigma28 factor (negative regulator of flagellin synthesis)